MSSDFRAIVPVRDAQWRRASDVRGSESGGRKKAVSRAKIVEQLPVHLVALEKEMNSESRNIDIISSSLRCIVTTVREEFPYDVVYPFKTHLILIELLSSPLPLEDIANILFILCRGYMSDRNGRNLLIENKVPATLLAILASGCDASCVGSLFVGLRHLIVEVPDFKRHFIESGFVKQVLGAYEALQADMPALEMCLLLKAMMYAPIEDGWVETLMSVVPVLLSYVAAEEPAQTRIAFQALRHLSTVRPETREELARIGVVRVSLDLLLSSETTSGVFGTVLHFMARFCADGKGVNDVVSLDLVNAAVEQLHGLIDHGAAPRTVNHVFVDVVSLLRHERETTKWILETELYAFMKEVIVRGSPYVLHIEASRVVGVIVLTRDVELISMVYENDIMARAIDALLKVDDERMNRLGLDAVGVFFDVATASANEEWLAVKGQPWLREALEGMLDDLSKEDIHELANHVMTTVLAPPQ